MVYNEANFSIAIFWPLESVAFYFYIEEKIPSIIYTRLIIDIRTNIRYND